MDLPAPLLAFFTLGTTEAIVVCVIALLLFGPRLPQVMRSLGKGIVEFKKGIRDTEDEINREIDTADRPSERTIEHSADK